MKKKDQEFWSANNSGTNLFVMNARKGPVNKPIVVQTLKEFNSLETTSYDVVFFVHFKQLIHKL